MTNGYKVAVCGGLLPAHTVCIVAGVSRKQAESCASQQAGSFGRVISPWLHGQPVRSGRVRLCVRSGTMIEKCIFVLLLSLLGLWSAVSMAEMNDRKTQIIGKVSIVAVILCDWIMLIYALLSVIGY